MEDVLSPCPFCGGEAGTWVQSLGNVGVCGCLDREKACMMRPCIGFDVNDASGRERAIRQWNRRPAAQSDFNAGIVAAAKFVGDRRDGYISEHGNYDYTTGVTEFPGDGEDMVGEWDEIEEGILALRKAAS